MTTIHFIGVGPGDPELLTLKAQRLIASAEHIVYAGSLIPAQILSYAQSAVRVIDSSNLTREEIGAEFIRAQQHQHNLARLHSGDLSLYAAIHEQIEWCELHNISWDMTPGVPAFAAASSCLGHELTYAGGSQSVILTRVSGKASPVPNTETIAALAQHQCTLVLHLSVQALALVVRELSPILGLNYPAAVAYALGWPQQQIIHATLGTIRPLVKQAKITRQALIILGKVLDPQERKAARSRLYDAQHQHTFRKVHA